MLSLRNRALPFFLIGVWAIAVAGGFLGLGRYRERAGTLGGGAARWPAAAALPAPTSRPTLLVFLHPKCPCSRATVAELDRILAESGARARVVAIFPRPPSWTVDDVKDDLWRRVTAIPGVDAFIDDGGVEAKRFGAETSGLVLLYSRRGELVFRGGVTPGRGHEGDSAGHAAVVTYLRGEAGAGASSPVFGCAL